MNKKDVEKLLKGRELIDKYRLRNIDKETLEQKNSLLDGVKVGLGKLGFEKDAMEEFKAFNKHLIAQEFKEIFSIEYLGCDKCRTKKCIQMFRDKVCVWKKEEQVDDAICLYILSLGFQSKNSNWANNEVGGIDSFRDVQVCPDGCGYQISPKKRNPQFDLNWRV